MILFRKVSTIHFYFIYATLFATETDLFQIYFMFIYNCMTICCSVKEQVSKDFKILAHKWHGHVLSLRSLLLSHFAFFRTYTCYSEYMSKFTLTSLAKCSGRRVLRLCTQRSKSWVWKTGHLSPSMVAILATQWKRREHLTWENGVRRSCSKQANKSATKSD